MSEQTTIGALSAGDIDRMLAMQPGPMPVNARILPLGNGEVFKLAIFTFNGVSFSDWPVDALRSLYDMIGQALGIEPAPKVQVARPEDVAMLGRVLGAHGQ